MSLAPIKQSFPHRHSEEEANVRARAAFDYYASEYPEANAKVVWQNPRKATVSFAVSGAVYSGVLEIKPGVLEMTVNVPAHLKAVLTPYVGIVGQEVAKWLT